MPATLYFCSWNIQVGLRRDALMKVIRDHPDFHRLELLALQEASAHALGDDASGIAGILGQDYASYFHIYHQLKQHPQANALVWDKRRVRLDAIERHTLPSHLEVNVPRAERAVLNRLKRQPRVNLVASGEWRGHTLRVCTAHLDVLGYRFKRQQFAAVLEDLRSRPPVDLTILAGDFNTFQIGGHPTWTQLRRDAGALGLQAITGPILWTQHMPRLRWRQKLDEIFIACARPFQARVWTLDVRTSDHLPVFAEIQVE